MFKLRPTVLVLSTCLLQACAMPPARQQMVVHPVLRVDHSSSQAAATYHQLGKYHQERGNLDLAIAAYTRAIALDSWPLETRNALASIHSRRGRLEEAKSVLLQLVADYPAVAHPYNNLGYVYYMQGNYAAAVSTLQRALALDPANERARNNLKLAEAAAVRNGEDGASALRLSPSAITAPLASNQPAPEAGPSVPPDARHAHPQGIVPANTTSGPQTRLELVQVVPNIFELKLKAPYTQVAAERQAGKTTVAATPPVPAITPTLKTSRIEIANGNGVAGMASRISQLLGQQGITANRLTNERPYRQQYTRIAYRAGYEQEAAALNNALQGGALVAESNNLPSRSDVRLLLGKDAIARMKTLEESANDLRLTLNVKFN